MINKIKKLGSFISNMRQTLNFDIKEAALFQYFNTINTPKASGENIVSLQCIEDPFYFALFGQIVSSIREKNPIEAQHILMYSLRPKESLSFSRLIFTRLGTNILKIKWKRLYNSFCNKAGYNTTGLSHPISDLIDIVKAYRCWKRLTNKDDLIKLKIQNVFVGDLVNDSFLRFKPLPTVKLSSRYLWIVIWQAYRDIRIAKKYFLSAKPKLYLTSYSTYIQHGIPVRVALQQGVPVFAIASNRQEFAKQLSDNDWVHTKNPDNYATDFLKVENSAEKLRMADNALTHRIMGGIDAFTSYMKKSAYEETNPNVPDVSGALVIFLHDFFDSPHVYRNMVFPDFWEWICFTIDTLERAGIPYFIKPHPNQIGLSDEVMAQLKQQYPDIRLIPSDITNKQLINQGMVCAITVYGTVAHEMAFLGVPTIASANHPHVSFDFCITAKNKAEYAEMLKNSTTLKFNKQKMKDQSLAFYYMHNLNMDDDERELNNCVVKLFKESETADSDLSTMLKYIESLPAYKAYISKISAFI
jgi:hypothetical protein